MLVFDGDIWCMNMIYDYHQHFLPQELPGTPIHLYYYLPSFPFGLYFHVSFLLLNYFPFDLLVCLFAVSAVLFTTC